VWNKLAHKYRRTLDQVYSSQFSSPKKAVCIKNNKPVSLQQRAAAENSREISP